MLPDQSAQIMAVCTSSLSMQELLHRKGGRTGGKVWEWFHACSTNLPLWIYYCWLYEVF